MKSIKHLYFFIIIIFISENAFGIPNCYIYKEDENCYKACKEAEEAIKYPQGSKASQEHFLKSIELCPTFAYSFFEQSVPYAKRGLMNEWIDMINKAVELDPEMHLATRGWYHWFFMHNYEAAIADVDRLEAMVPYDIGPTGDAYYHLNIMKALCYKGLGNSEKAIELIENCMDSEGYFKGPYDNIHLGVLYLEKGELSKALTEFEKQMQYNNMSEAYFYSAKVYQILNDLPSATENLNLALKMYDQGRAMHNQYRQLVDEIYRVDIEEELKIVAEKL